MTSGKSISEPRTTHTGKRRRVSHEYIQDKDVWMEDGNIIIAAMDPTSDAEESPTYVFKCHKSVLSKQSSVFEQMLNIPPSDNADDVYEGLPLVILPDPYQDVKAVLRFLYEPGDIPLQAAPSHSVPECNQVMESLHGPIRFAHKYEFSKLHARLAVIVQSYWPLTLAQWDSRNYDDLGLTSKLRADCVIKLAYEANVPNILPCAFYVLASNWGCMGKAAHFEIWRHSGEFAGQAARRQANHFLGHLPLSCFMQLITGLETLRSTTRFLLDTVLPKATQYAVLCTYRRHRPGNKSKNSLTPCAPYIEDWWAEMDRFVREMVAPREPFTDLSFYQEKADRPSPEVQNACEACRENISLSIGAMRRFLWDILPHVFGLEGAGATSPKYRDYLEPRCTNIP